MGGADGWMGRGGRGMGEVGISHQGGREGFGGEEKAKRGGGC